VYKKYTTISRVSDAITAKIPLLFGLMLFTVIKPFPPLGEAASWDLAAMEQSARIAAIELCFWNWTLHQWSILFRDPR
jgi:beta-glucosidase